MLSDGVREHWNCLVSPGNTSDVDLVRCIDARRRIPRNTFLGTLFERIVMRILVLFTLYSAAYGQALDLTDVTADNNGQQDVTAEVSGVLTNSSAQDSDTATDDEFADAVAAAINAEGALAVASAKAEIDKDGATAKKAAIDLKLDTQQRGRCDVHAINGECRKQCRRYH